MKSLSANDSGSSLLIFDCTVLFFVGLALGFTAKLAIDANFLVEKSLTTSKLLELSILVFMGTVVTRSINRSGVHLTHVLLDASRRQQKRVSNIIARYKDLHNKLSDLGETMGRHKASYLQSFQEISVGASNVFSESAEDIKAEIQAFTDRLWELASDLEEINLCKRKSSQIVDVSGKNIRLVDSFNKAISLLYDLSVISNVQHEHYNFGRGQTPIEVPQVDAYSKSIDVCFSLLKKRVELTVEELNINSSST
ncbi:MAG: hypothetical protein H6616_17840 [Ignavibacteria bacterium]|nr:hypothetical protein [Ignavibacteria bacterium]